MDAEEALRLVEDLIRVGGKQPLNDLQRTIFRGAWQGKGYKEIHQDCSHVGLDHLMRNVGPSLWRLLSTVLSEALGEAVTIKKDYLQGAIERLGDRPPPSPPSPSLPAEPLLTPTEPAFEPMSFSPEPVWQSPSLNRLQDWGLAPDATLFQGRTRELAELQQWVEEDGCRLVALYGMAGMGKTALSVRLAEQLRDQFEVVIWRSLDETLLGHTPPALATLLADWMGLISGQSDSQPDLATFLAYLRENRCLLVLDGFEAVFNQGVLSGEYLDTYRGYGELLSRVSDTYHLSCIVITGQEKPREVEAREGDYAPVRSQKLRGLGDAEAQALFATKGSFSGSKQDWSVLTQRYDGNPAFLQQIATTIANICGRDITRFLALQPDKPMFVRDIRACMMQQLERLSEPERILVKALARTPTSVILEDLQQMMQQPLSRDRVLEVLLSLARRSLLETNTSPYRLHPIIVDYVNEREQIG